MPLKDLPADAQPREKLLSRGAAALSDTELLALLLRTGTARRGVLQMADDVLRRFDGLNGLLNARPDDLKEVHGLGGTAKRAELIAVMELAKRALAQQLKDREVFGTPNAVKEFLQAHLAHRKQEVFAVLIKKVVAMQQSYAGSGRLLEASDIGELLDDAIRMQGESIKRHRVQVQRDYAPVDVVALDRTRVMQILVNLVANARQAMDSVEGERRMDVAVRQEAGWIEVSVRDCGCGISAENLGRIFTHGFTTKADGHGFGLHSCAAAASEMGGSLQAHSDGPGTGATFVLRLPAAAPAGGVAASG